MKKSRLLEIILLLPILLFVTSANAATWTAINGRVLAQTGAPLCSMVLANGQDTFSCGGDGSYNLDVPLDSNGLIRLFGFASGFGAFDQMLTPGEAINYTINMVRDDTGKLLTVTPIVVPSSRKDWVVVSGTIDDSGAPVCAFILVNGKSMFTCNNDLGQFNLDVPLDSSGNIALQAFASGFQAYKETLQVAEDPATLNGRYEGVKKAFGTCAAPTFQITASDTTISIQGNIISINQDSFFDGICLFDGTITQVSVSGISAEGAFRCSNFDDGTWSSTEIVKTGDDSFLATLQVNVANRGCSYEVKYIGFK